MADKPSLPGYVPTWVPLQAIDWQFEVVSEEPKTALVTIRTVEGAVLVGLNEEDARRLRNNLDLFLDNSKTAQ